MKWMLLLVAAAAVFFFWPARPGSQLAAARHEVAGRVASVGNSVGASVRSDTETRELLATKKEELKAYEDTLEKVEADIVRMSQVGTCAVTGQPNRFELNQDPRPDLRERIAKVKEEIAELEKRLAKS